MNIEIIFLKELIGGEYIYISDKRITIGRRTFPTDHVSSVELHVHPYRWNMTFFVIIAIISSIIAYMTWDNQFLTNPISPKVHIWFTVAALILVYIVYRFGRLRYIFSVLIGSTSGIINAFSSSEHSDVERIVENIKKSISDRERM